MTMNNLAAIKRVHRRAPEHDLQTRCLAYARANYPATRGLLFAIPNGGARDARTGATLKREGVLAGVPDMALVSAGQTHYFEFKAPKGRASRAQLDLHASWMQQGVAVRMIRNPVDWARALEDILGVLPDTPANRLKRLHFTGLID